MLELGFTNHASVKLETLNPKPGRQVLALGAMVLMPSTRPTLNPKP